MTPDHIAALLTSDVSIFDPYDYELYIPDARYDAEENFIVESVMAASIPRDLPLDRQYHVDTESLTNWALGHVPAPGTGAPDRMALFLVEEVADFLANHRTTLVLLSE